MSGHTVFVELLEEGTPCWRPVEAEPLADDLFRLIGAKPDDESWAFNTGDIVRCKSQSFQNGQGLVAYEKVR